MKRDTIHNARSYFNNNNINNNNNALTGSRSLLNIPLLTDIT